MCQFGRGLPPVLAGDHRAKFGARQNDLDKLDSVFGEDCDHAPGDTTITKQRRNDAIHASIEFTVAEPASPIRNRKSVRIPLRSVPKHAPD